MVLSWTGIAASAILMIARFMTFMFRCFLAFGHQALASEWSGEQYSPKSPRWSNKYQDVLSGWMYPKDGYRNAAHSENEWNFSCGSSSMPRSFVRIADAAINVGVG